MNPQLTAMSEVITGLSGALHTVVGLMIDKGLVSPAEVMERLSNASDEVLKGGGSQATALPIEQLRKFVAMHDGDPRRPS